MAAKVCVLRAPGTNCDRETLWCLEKVGLSAAVVHVKRLLDGAQQLSSFQALVIPGGFSYGDHVRAGALLGKTLEKRLSKELEEFTASGKPILGICNGFQVLVECGLLPGEGLRAALTTNASSVFECRWVWLRVEETACLFTRDMMPCVSLPVAHGEGRFLAGEEELAEMRREKLVALTYALPDGSPARERYPYNPNGSLHDIAGLCNRAGNVLGLMPHPERAFLSIHHPCWTRAKSSEMHGHGYKVFKNMAAYLDG